MIRPIILSRTDTFIVPLFESMERNQRGALGGVVVADNGLSPEVKKAYFQPAYVPVPNPFCFSKAVNAAEACTRTSDDLMILNDDTEAATTNFLYRLEKLLDTNRDYGIISCSIEGGAYNKQNIKYNGEDVSKSDLIEEPSVTLAFIAVVISRQCWSAVGLMDERFTGYGCLNAEGRVLMADGSTAKISDLVREKNPGPILSLNEKTFEIEHKAVTGWWKNKSESNQQWVKVRLRRSKRQNRVGWSQSGVVFTPAHMIRTTEGWTRVDGLRAGNRVPIPEPRLSSRQREFVLGTLLGDASIQSKNDQRAGFTVSHCEKQWGYLDLKKQMLGRLATTEHEHQYEIGQRQKKLCSSYTVEFADLHDMAYPNEKKTVSREWLEQIGPFGFALFYMDDGVLARQDSARIGVYSYGEKGARLIQERLHELGIGSTLDRDSRQDLYSNGIEPYVIRMRKSETKDFMRMIGRFVPPSMRYKVTDDAPAFEPETWESQETLEPYDDEIVAVESFTPSRFQTSLHARYCLTVEDNHNFFTSSGLAHNFEDNDYCLRARKAGFKTGVTRSVIFKHGRDGRAHSSSFLKYNGERKWNELRTQNQILFNEKWGIQ